MVFGRMHEFGYVRFMRRRVLEKITLMDEVGVERGFE